MLLTINYISVKPVQFIVLHNIKGCIFDVELLNNRSYQ